jgi:transitional endoplasmic reticulum ATPase
MYQLLFGLPPWFKEISNFQKIGNTVEECIIEERSKPLIFPDISKSFIDFDIAAERILRKALANQPEKRFQTAKEFIEALNNEIEIKEISNDKTSNPVTASSKPSQNKNEIKKGFAQIAGMKELKEQLKLDVIDALKNPQEYAEYGVTIPNGMLLYGPPGCGKTFFAKNFANEVGFNFVLTTPSTLQSRYINATRENVAKMFKEAEKNAPIVIFIDEIEVLLANRANSSGSEHSSMFNEAVNEMLAQMDRTGEKGIFVIGATNYPNLIDPAMLRTGRLDKKFYLPPPDFDARKEMFQMYLKNRPLDFGIDYDRLSKLTENYVSSDIEFLSNEAAKLALKTKSRISMEIIEQTIKSIKPSVSIQELEKFKEIKNNMGFIKTPSKIGFRK